jgi:methyl acetate hydrolase
VNQFLASRNIHGTFEQTGCGLANTYFWVDPSKRVAGVILTQILPFVDPAVMKLYAQFESGVYKAISST